jgi:hypothetical protein
VGLQATHENQLLYSYIQEIELHNPESVTAKAAWILWLPVTCKPIQIHAVYNNNSNGKKKSAYQLNWQGWKVTDEQHHSLTENPSIHWH